MSNFFGNMFPQNEPNDSKQVKEDTLTTPSAEDNETKTDYTPQKNDSDLDFTEEKKTNKQTKLEKEQQESLKKEKETQQKQEEEKEKRQEKKTDKPLIAKKPNPKKRSVTNDPVIIRENLRNLSQ